MISHALQTACDDLGVRLWIADGGKLSFRAGDAGFPDHVRDALREHRPELVALLEQFPRPDPDAMLFVAKNLAVESIPFPFVRTVPVFWAGDRPHYRLTPATWVWFMTALDRQPRPEPNAVALLNGLGPWVEAHYRPDQISRAFGRPPRLPTG